MQPHGLSRAAEGLAVCAIALALIVPRPAGATDEKKLHLEVYVNDAPVNLIAAFAQRKDGRMAALRSELNEVGIKTGAGAKDDIVALEQIPGLSYRYDEPAQKIFLQVPNSHRIPKHLSMNGGDERDVRATRSDYGALLNYNVWSAVDFDSIPHRFRSNPASLSLEARAFGPFGTITQSGILRGFLEGNFEALRLDTTFEYADEKRLITYRAGDTISGGLPWTRPIRMGGIQAQRSFSLRPDLITMPLPVLSGSAAVPSTVDLYVNNVRALSQDVGNGPFTITNLPVVSGKGTTRMVVRDSSGRETVSTSQFYASPTLLAPDLTNFSLEAGFPRLSFGTSADRYGDTPAGSMTLRRGIFDWLTVEAHGELSSGLVNGGVGVVMQTGIFGVAGVSAAASRFGDEQGTQLYFSFETKLGEITFSASSQRTFGLYNDLASATARAQFSNSLHQLSELPYFGPAYFLAAPVSQTPWTLARAPRALDRVAVGMPMPGDRRSSLTASFVHLEDAGGYRSNIFSGTWSRALPYDASLSITAFTDIADRTSTGVFAALSVPLGASGFASVGATHAYGQTQTNIDAGQPLDQRIGSWGWRVRDIEGKWPYRQASVAYRGSAASVLTGVVQDRNGARLETEIEGAVVTLGNGAFFSNRIGDAFGIVETGVPAVEVSQENRPIGVTDSHGRILVPNLNGYQRNKIGIDPRNLPLNAEAVGIEQIVVPASRSGVRIDFNVQKEIKAAIVIFNAPDGKPLPAGARGKTRGGEEFVVGYDGRAYVKSLEDNNEVEIILAEGSCKAAFGYRPQPDRQVVIEAVVCR